jgi:hypothetical protein
VVESLLMREESVVVVVGEAGTARCRVAVAPTSTVEARGAAARAAAVVQASWAWDESPEIVVSVDEETIVVSPRYDAEGWFADAKPEGRDSGATRRPFSMP